MSSSRIVQMPVRVLRIIVFLFFLMPPTIIHSWDLAVASDEGLSLLTIKGALEAQPISSVGNDSLTEMYALAYDPAASRFFFSISNKNYSIYEYDLIRNNIAPVIPKAEYEVQGLAYEPSLQILYWTDGNGHTIRRKVLNAKPLIQETVFTHIHQVPMGIAVSHCHRAIFWANNNHTTASLNRAELEGTNHEAIVTTDVFQPLGVTVDELYGKIYWTDDRPGIYYRIERCGLDGSDRELVLQRTNQEPFGITLVSSTLIWSDMIGKKLWSLSTDMTFPNHTMAHLEPRLMYQFAREKPVGVVANRNISAICEPVKVLRTVIEEQVNEDAELADEAPAFCLNDGQLINSLCRCRRGYSGRWCEVNLCYQHCLHGGTCTIDRHGYAECQCGPGYEGRRCERDVCDEFCLAGGRCYVESGQPTCQCPAPTTGQRCEVSAALTTMQGPQDLSIVAALSAVGCALLIAVAVLSWRVIVLRRRPRVKKRYIVNKSYRAQSGPTPMTSRPPVAPAVEQCEITIENCCNMNICETPCFEPNLRTSKSQIKKTEDRRNLLSNMEEPGGSD